MNFASSTLEFRINFLRTKQEGKKTDTAKFLQHKIKEKYEINFPLDEIVQTLPGDCSVDMQ